MKKPRISTLIILVQFILLLACLVWIVFLFAHNYGLKLQAEDYAAQAGYDQARRNFLRGEHIVYEMQLFEYHEDSGPMPTDGDTEPSGKTEGSFQVWYFKVNKNLPKMYQEVYQAFIDGYNQHIHQCFEHPEKLDKNGLPIPVHELHPQTNTLNSVRRDLRTTIVNL